MIQQFFPEWPAVLSCAMFLLVIVVFALAMVMEEEKRMDAMFAREDWDRHDDVGRRDGDGSVTHMDVLLIQFQNDTDTYYFRFEPRHRDNMCRVVTSMAADPLITFSWTDAAAVNRQIRDAVACHAISQSNANYLEGI